MNKDGVVANQRSLVDPIGEPGSSVGVNSISKPTSPMKKDDSSIEYMDRVKNPKSIENLDSGNKLNSQAKPATSFPMKKDNSSIENMDRVKSTESTTKSPPCMLKHTKSIENLDSGNKSNSQVKPATSFPMKKDDSSIEYMDRVESTGYMAKMATANGTNSEDSHESVDGVAVQPTINKYEHCHPTNENANGDSDDKYASHAVQHGPFRKNMRKKLTTKEAETLLKAVSKGKQDGAVYTTPLPDSVIPKGGDIFVFRVPIEQEADAVNSDRILWKGSGSMSTNKPVIRKHYYLKKGTGQETDPRFSKTVYKLRENKNRIEMAIIVQYSGDEKLVQRRKHGNATKSNRLYAQTMPSVRKELKDKAKIGVNPRMAYIQTTRKTEETYKSKRFEPSEVEVRYDNVEDIGARNLKQAQNFKYSVDHEEKISDDPYYNLMELASGPFKDIISYISFDDDFYVVLIVPEVLNLSLRLLKASALDPDLEQMISYDTTFEIGNFYVSFVAMKNTELEGNPLMCTFALLHNRKHMATHTHFWRDFVAHKLELDNYGHNVPIMCDRELGLIKAISTSCLTAKNNLLFCQNHLKQNVREFLTTKVNADPEKLKGFSEHINDLINCDTIEKFDELYETLKKTWTKDFVIYADKNIKNALRKGCIKAVTKRFAAFKNCVPTNNLSESLHADFKKFIGGKQLKVNDAVIAIANFQLTKLSEMNRPYKDLGSYTLKSNLRDTKLPGNQNPDLQILPKFNFWTNKEIIDKLKSNSVNECKKRKSPSTNIAYEALASINIENQFLTYEPKNKCFVVRNPLDGLYSAVDIEKKTCTCGINGCFHIYAVKRLLGTEMSKSVTATSLLIPMIRSGRKKPRRDDYDYSITAAPDSTFCDQEGLYGDEYLKDINISLVNDDSDEMDFDYPTSTLERSPDRMSISEKTNEIEEHKMLEKSKESQTPRAKKNISFTNVGLIESKQSNELVSTKSDETANNVLGIKNHDTIEEMDSCTLPKIVDRGVDEAKEHSPGSGKSQDRPSNIIDQTNNDTVPKLDAHETVSLLSTNVNSLERQMPTLEKEEIHSSNSYQMGLNKLIERMKQSGVKEVEPTTISGSTSEYTSSGSSNSENDEIVLDFEAVQQLVDIKDFEMNMEKITLKNNQQISSLLIENCLQNMVKALNAEKQVLVVESGMFCNLHKALHGMLVNKKEISRHYQTAFRYLQRNEAANKDVLAILFPLDVSKKCGVHWFLDLINFEKKKICVLDGLHTLPESISKHMKTLLTFVILTYQIANLNFDRNEWALEVSKDCQLNRIKAMIVEFTCCITSFHFSKRKGLVYLHPL